MKRHLLKRGINTGLATLLTTLAAHPGVAAEIDEIVVTSQYLEETIPLELSRYGNQVEIITAEEIRERGFVDITQTLQMMVPGLHIAPKNGPFDYFDASLQGSRAQEILWLVDGVRITNRLYNGTSPLDTVPAHMVERIEVLKGGQGIFYGTQSVGGVVNIVTRAFSQQNTGALSTGVNSNNGFNVNGFFSGASGDHQLVVYGSRDDADGYTPWAGEDIQPSATDHERGYEVSTAGVKYAWNATAESRLSLQYQLSSADLDFARPFLNNTGSNDREEEILTMKYDWQVSDNIELFIKAYRHTWDTEFTQIDNELDAGGNLTGGVRVVSDGAFWGYEDTGFNAMAKLNYGGNFEYVLGFDHQNFSGEDEVWRIADQEETVNAPFIQIRTTNELFADSTLALGIRNNQASDADDSTVWNLTGKHFFNDSLYVQGNLGTSFRLPDAEALFLNEYYDNDNDGVPDGGWFAIGNPDLEPEQSNNINLSLGGNLYAMNVEMTVFKRDIENYIESYVPITIGGVEGESFINTRDEVNMEGLELVAAMPLSDTWSTQLSYTRTRAQLNNSGAQLTGIPRSEGKIRLDYRAAGLPLGVSLNSNFVSDINARRGASRDSYVVTDLSAFYNAGSDEQHRIVLRLENVTDEEYTTRIDLGTEDATGESYLYRNLGMERTLHLSYTYRF
ncbi:MAG: TonB-dependent receptor [Pseudohongiellaceae bacterium]